MSFFNSIATSGSALTAQRLRMDVISNNIANSETTRTPQGGAYRRQQVIFQPRESSSDQPIFDLLHAGAPPAVLFNSVNSSDTSGVQVASVVDDQSPTRLVYQPNNPDANGRGYVEYPNVNTVSEMVDMMSATRSYQANVTALDAAKQMALRALDIGRA